MLFERLEEPLGSDADLIKSLREVDWSDIVNIDWMNMTSEGFERYVSSKFPKIPAPVFRKINTLRKRAKDLYQPGNPANEALIEGRIVPVWTLADEDRKTIALFPFIAKGYEEAKEAA